MTNTMFINVFYEPTDRMKCIFNTIGSEYVLVNGGNSLRNSSDQWVKDRIKPDNSSISNLNHIYNEMTTIRHIYENMPDSDFIGHGHYRRLFDNDMINAFDYDILVKPKIPMLYMKNINGKPTVVKGTIESGYKICHLPYAWDIMETEIAKTPLSDVCADWKHQHELTAPCQMFVMKREIFKEYCEFVFPMLERILPQLSLENVDNYQKRQLAFIAERLLSLFVYYKMHVDGSVVKECLTTFYPDFKPDTAKDNRGDFS